MSKHINRLFALASEHPKLVLNTMLDNAGIAEAETLGCSSLADLRARATQLPRPTFVALLEMQTPSEAADLVGQVRAVLDSRSFGAADGVLSC